ncbi:hypothetical protein [Georgenia soli]|nr:hypothetical protein [Georgenia soli]
MSRTTAPRLARTLVLLASGALAAAGLAACTGASSGDGATAPGSGSTASETSAPEPTAAAEPATVTWDHPELEGYAVSEEPPTDTVVQLENDDLACLLQLTHEVIPDAGIDDSTYTDTAIKNATSALGEITETGREDSAIPSDAGPLAAREVSLTASSGAQELDVRMLLRASSADQVLVGLVHVCPAGGLDEATWDSFVAGTTLHGTTATSF